LFSNGPSTVARQALDRGRLLQDHRIGTIQPMLELCALLSNFLLFKFVFNGLYSTFSVLFYSHNKKRRIDLIIWYSRLLCRSTVLSTAD